jgi:hypothetical protein
MKSLYMAILLLAVKQPFRDGAYGRPGRQSLVSVLKARDRVKQPSVQ